MQETKLTLNDRKYLQLPAEMREQYLDPDQEEVLVQAVGVGLQVALDKHHPWLLFVPFEEWETGKPRKRKLNRGGIHVARWRDNFETDEEGRVEAVIRGGDDDITG